MRANQAISKAVAILKGAVILSWRPQFSTKRFPEIVGKLRVSVQGKVSLGRGFSAEGRPMPAEFIVARGATLTIGDSFYMNSGAAITAHHEVRIGDHVMFAPLVSVIDDHRHEIEPGASLYERPVVIGDNVWLGRNVVVLPGVTIGAGSVVGANSVVSQDIPPSVFAAGAPAKVIRELNLPDGWHRI
jgi:maltose O-acetyltransferase